MLLATLFSTLYFLTAPVQINPSMEVIQEHHLTTSEGRSTFLVEKLAPYATEANRLNHDIEMLAETIKILSPQKDQQQILTLTLEMNQKMSTLLNMMSVLSLSQTLDEDFSQIDSILHQEEPLTPSQCEIVNRIASLCNSME